MHHRREKLCTADCINNLTILDVVMKYNKLGT